MAADRDVVSTYCRQAEVPLDALHSAARLEGCGGDARVDLLWDLDRIDQLDPSLDGLYHRGRGGAGVVVYVMDTGVLACRGLKPNLRSGTSFAAPIVSGIAAGKVAFVQTKTPAIAAHRVPESQARMVP